MAEHDVYCLPCSDNNDDINLLLQQLSHHINVTVTSSRQHSAKVLSTTLGNSIIAMSSLVSEHGRQYMPCPANFSMMIQTEILSTEATDFLNQILFSSYLTPCFCRNCLPSRQEHQPDTCMMELLFKQYLKKSFPTCWHMWTIC